MTVRRTLGAAAAAAAITLVPTAAFATYGDAAVPEVVEPGETFSVPVDGPVGTEEIVLTISSDDAADSDIEIAGTQSLAKAADVQGDATFSVTLNAEGTYSVVAEADGEVVLSDTVVVAEDEDAAAGGAAAGDNAAGGTLPDTGATSTPLVVGAAALLAAGAGALLFARRQQQA